MKVVMINQLTRLRARNVHKALEHALQPLQNPARFLNPGQARGGHALVVLLHEALVHAL